jgi:hypothetical protein
VRPGAYSVVTLPRWASPVQYGTYTMEWSANGLRSSARSKMPPVDGGPSPIVVVESPRSGAQVAAEKHTPPSWR